MSSENKQAKQAAQKADQEAAQPAIKQPAQQPDQEAAQPAIKRPAQQPDQEAAQPAIKRPAQQPDQQAAKPVIIECPGCKRFFEYTRGPNCDDIYRDHCSMLCYDQTR
jgi:hypothetical protein